MTHARINRWDKYQDWSSKASDDFKVTARILTDDKMLKLTKEQRWDFIALMAHVAKTHNLIDTEAHDIDFEALAEVGLISMLDEAETKKWRDIEKQKRADARAFAKRCQKYWNAIGCRPEWVKMSPKVVVLTDIRRKEYGDEKIKEAMDNVASSSFLGFTFSGSTPAWVFKAENFEKVVAGAYNRVDIDPRIDAWEMNQSTKIRGYDEDTTPPTDKRAFLVEDIRYVNGMMSRHGKQPRGPHGDRIAWFKKQFGMHPYEAQLMAKRKEKK